MNVANLDLSRILFELSGWGEESNLDWYVKTETFDGGCTLTERLCPKYHLDYLLHKLPEIRLETWHDGHVVIKHYTDNGIPDRLERKGKVVTVEADNPTDATCSLAIRLFKAGILTKETK